ncbi:conjugal transfer protein TraG [Bacillus sp. M6-12]|uniref:type IV secretory system conjugative DNA transfer family protein n=1 Tax=Bacillus sp. M6-12 TaxID=2054166 RepID=UPI000C77289C|nr:type IV secretory system conjugative DNA transfer family protein [Bacillus sp. M6-12]PLS19701.1 conjugal transfer protein TraG [Bacillus sp. M6-12]
MSENKNKLSAKATNVLKEQFNTIITALFTLQIANFVSAYLFYKGLIVVTFTLFALIFIVFAVGKDYTEEKSKKYGFKIFKISLLIFILSLVNHFFLMLGGMSSSESKAHAIFRLSIFINIATSIGIMTLVRKDETKDVFNNIYENSILEKFGLKSSTTETKQGDIKIAVNKDTGKEEILPFKDRFLHMLVLGPTGSGKTSQTIIPMINQDMQNPDCGITVIEPKADLAEKIYAMAKHYGRPVIYFNPILPDCPYFNPLFGKEEDVIENIATTFKMLSPDSPQFFMDMNENLIRNALKVLKRTMANDATFIDLYTLIANPGGAGRKMVMSFSRMNAESAEIAKENSDIAQYFLNDYFNEKSKTYEHCSAVRTQVGKLISNKFLRKVLNPPAGKNDIDFDKHLAEGGVIAIATAQGTLRDLGRFLGYFIILQFQASVFRRPGNENTRLAHFLYIDEFQVYANPGFADMLTQGRSYRVASHLATQNRALIGMGRGQEGKDFIELVSTNARNIIIYPGGNALDAKYYSDQFGEILKKTLQKGVSSQKFNPLYGFQKMSYDNVSVRETEAMEARFSPSDIMYRPFGEITYLLIKKNSIQSPAVGTIEYIPVELNNKLDAMIEEYNENIFKKPSLDNTSKEDSSEETPQQAHVQDLVLQKEPVIAKNPVVAPATKKEIPDRVPNIDDFILVEEKKKPVDKREFISPDDDFTDDIVLEADDKPFTINEAKKNDSSSDEISFMNDEEDDLI